MCVAMLIGSTFAWFTDSVTSSNNKIQAGTLKIDLLLKDGDDNWTSIKESGKAIFDYDLWEPGYTDVKVLKVVNKGSLALKWMAKFVSDFELTALADVIDVYVNTSVQDLPANRADIATWDKVGTVRDFVNTIQTTTTGELTPEGSANDSAYLGIALKMQETAGNDYQGMSLGGVFDIQILATQLTYEEDSFDNQYDKDATLDFAPVSNANELRVALANNETNIVLTKDIIVDDTFTVDYNANINGGGNAIYRTDGTSFMSSRSTPVIYTDTVFTVKTGATLTLENVVVDGGAVWGGEVNQTLQRGTVNSGVTATGALVTTEANAHIVLGEGAVLQNNDGANAVNLGTRAGATLTLNGGEIINNHSAAGAIWGGGAIIVNSGKINNNHGGIGGAIRAVTNIGTLLTMNGGEMNHNYSDGNGGAIWAGSSRSNNVYVLNGGEMAYNYSAATGGAIYAGYYETVKIGGSFKMHDNDCAATLGAAIRFHDHASFVMTGGEIYNNGDDGNSLFLYNNSASITGGKIVDNFGYSGGLGLTWGNAEVDGVIAYDLSTNHNTAYLAKEFNTLKFTVNEADEHFSNFNFKPAADYVYTEGDEAKLICMNEGYETYWDTTTGTFRLQAN